MLTGSFPHKTTEGELEPVDRRLFPVPEAIGKPHDGDGWTYLGWQRDGVELKPKVRIEEAWSLMFPKKGAGRETGQTV